jgi:hypothetical protein
MVQFQKRVKNPLTKYKNVLQWELNKKLAKLLLIQ